MAVCRRPLVMGVVNVTPDSFSDGGRYLDPEGAITHGLKLVDEGADLLDVGGESTRPGALQVSTKDEIARAAPVVRALVERSRAPVCIDTMKPEVARAAVEAGAVIWNDVNALRAHGAPETAAELGCGVVLMHMLGEPRTMQQAPRYGDVVAEVETFLLDRAEAAMTAGVARERIWLDPGIGFGKTLTHNLLLLAALPRMVAHGFPVLLGVSRKSFLKGLDPSAVDPQDRLGGSLAGALHGAKSGVHAVRVHDVAPTAQALKVWRAIQDAS